MPFGANFGVGFRRLIDAQMVYVRNGLPTYLRLRNFPDVQNQLWAQMGFSISPSGTNQTGTTDILIAPPPAVQSLSLQNIARSEGKLRFGAKNFLISSSFTDAQVIVRKLPFEDQVWKASDVVGLVEAGKLYSIENIKWEQLAGKTVTWTLTCNVVDPGG